MQANGPVILECIVSGTVPLSRHNYRALDGLRGLAILAVLFTHSTGPYPNTLVKKAVSLLFTHGWVGVDLFFVLSGFLITGILLDTRGCTNYFGSFYSRRALRIFPLYYTFLVFAWLLFPLIVRPEWLPTPADWWLYPTYLMNWLTLWKGVWHANIVGHFWSLCVEEQFYFVWPLVVLLIPSRWLLRTLLCAELAVIAGRAWWVFHHGASMTVNIATITRMDGLLVGAACAVAVRQFRFSSRAVVLLPSISAFCLALYLVLGRIDRANSGDTFNSYYGLPLLAIAFGAAVLAAVLTDSERSWVQTTLRYKPLTSVGKYAYGIYVFHVPVFYFVNTLTGNAPRPAWQHYFLMLTQFAISFGIAWLSYHFFEKRFLALKGRFEPERSSERKRSLEYAT